MKRKILLVSPFPPRRDGLHGGAQAIAHTIAELAENNIVRLLCLRGDGELTTEPALAETCELVEEIRRPGARLGFRRLRRLISSVSTGRPIWAGNWDVQHFRQRLHEIVTVWQPDVVHFHYQVMAQYRNAAQGRPAVLVVYEPGTVAARDRYAFCPAWQRPLLYADRLAWERYERGILSQFNAIVCLTPRDGLALETLAPRSKISVIAPAYGTARLPRSEPSPQSSMILFAGNFAHPPNIDAALRLTREIFPRVRELHPGARLTIVGERPPRVIRASAAPDVLVAGCVADFESLLDTAEVIAVPVRSGGGIRMKMIEALSHGKAVVATALAAEGLGISSGREFVRAQSDEEFAAAIAALMRDPSRRNALGQSALSWAAAYCRPGRVRDAYEALHLSLESRPLERSELLELSGRT